MKMGNKKNTPLVKAGRGRGRGRARGERGNKGNAGNKGQVEQVVEKKNNAETQEQLLGDLEEAVSPLGEAAAGAAGEATAGATVEAAAGAAGDAADGAADLLRLAANQAAENTGGKGTPTDSVKGQATVEVLPSYPWVPSRTRSLGPVSHRRLGASGTLTRLGRAGLKPGWSVWDSNPVWGERDSNPVWGERDSNPVGVLPVTLVLVP